MQEQDFSHRDGRSAVATTPAEAVTLRAMGFTPAQPVVESPSADWTHDQLDAYALAHNVDLTGAKTKADKVAAIQSPPAGDAQV
ncbi:MAG TPA: hypothetical protein VGF17_16990 [Phytomonospora sp.]|nr:hypothetical protein [Streptomycetaceae bacterium]